MSRFIKDMNEKGMAGLASEYRKIDIEDASLGSHKAFVMNMAKNRYSGKIFFRASSSIEVTVFVRILLIFIKHFFKVTCLQIFMCNFLWFCKVLYENI